MIDLHLHSTASDGSDTPSQLIDLALKLKLKAIAITDQSFSFLFQYLINLEILLMKNLSFVHMKNRF